MRNDFVSEGCNWNREEDDKIGVVEVDSIIIEYRTILKVVLLASMAGRPFYIRLLEGIFTTPHNKQGRMGIIRGEKPSHSPLVNSDISNIKAETGI